MAGRTYGGPSADEVRKKAAEEKARKHRKKIHIILGVTIGVLLLGSCTFGILAWQSNKQTEDIKQVWDDVRDVANVSSQPVDDGSGEFSIETSEPVTEEPEHEMTDIEAFSNEPIDRKIDWDSLLDINPDVLCWLYIPGTDIDYPVMQEQVLSEYYYLDHDIYGNELISGSLFTPKEPEGYEDKDMHMLIFGHNMRNGTMFSSLRRYMEASFYEQYPYIYLYYPDHTERWQVWSVYHTYATDSIYDIPYEANTKAYADLLSDIKSKRYYKTNVNDVKPSMNILTLSTCDNFDGTHTGRFVVNAAIYECKIFD